MGSPPVNTTARGGSDAVPDGATPWSRLAEWIRAHPQVADGTVGAALFAVSIPLATDPDPTIYPAGLRAIDPLGWLLLAGMALPVTWRRRTPVLVLVVTFACLLPTLALGYPEGFAAFGPLWALYSVAAHCERPRSLIAGGSAIGIFALLLVAGVVDEALPPAVAVANVFMVVGVFAIGEALRNRRAYTAELRRRVDTAERLRTEEAALAVAADRALIARELHDVVAHGMSVMVIQAAAAQRVLGRDPEAATEALEHIRRTGSESLAEMRRLLAVLREQDNGATTAPQPGVAELPALADSWRATGLDIELSMEVESDRLTPGLDLCAYRICQEALTNVAKHAGPAHTVVRVELAHDALEVSISDDGRGAASALRTTDAQPGNGLRGMRERVALFDGTLRAGPGDGGGWVVTATLPLGASSIVGPTPERPPDLTVADTDAVAAATSVGTDGTARP